MRNKLGILTGVLSAAAVAMLVVFPVPSGAAEVKTPLISVTPDGKKITFKGADGSTVKSKVSGSRTKIKIGGSDSDRKKLKAGMTCDITYKMDGKKNEPSMLNCM